MQPIRCGNIHLVLYGLQAEAQPGPCNEMLETAEVVCASGAETVRIPSICPMYLITEDVIQYSFHSYELSFSDSGSHVKSLLRSERGCFSL
jgi:hypothetical protein